MIHIYVHKGVVEGVTSDDFSEVGREVLIHDRDSRGPRDHLLHGRRTIETCDFTPEYHAGDEDFEDETPEEEDPDGQ